MHSRSTTTDLVRTARMTLRPVGLADLDELVALDADARVMHFVTNGAPIDRALEAEMLRSWVDEARSDPELGCWVALDRSSGRFLGWFQLFRDPDEPSTVELGYRLRHDVWNRGLATEGARALIDRVFLTTDVRCVRAETMAIHAASRRVMAKAGMRLHRRFKADWPVRIPGDEHGDVEYLLTRTDWAATSSDDATVAGTSWYGRSRRHG